MRRWPRPGASVRTAAAGLAVLFVALTIALLVPPWRHQLALSFSRQPTGFTELRFSAATALPATAGTGRPITADFTIVNHQTDHRLYRYRVTLAIIGAAPVTVTGQLDSDPEDAVRRVVTLRPNGTTRAYTVTVQLTGRTEIIRYRVAAAT